MSSKFSISKGESRPFATNHVHRLFEEKAKEHGGSNQALEFTDGCGTVRKVNYFSLNTLANQIANSILSLTHGASSNQDNDLVVAVCMAPTDNLIHVLLAIWKAGAAYLPLDFEFPLNRVQHILNETRPILVIYDDDYEKKHAFDKMRSISFAEIREDAENRSKENITDIEMLSQRNNDLAFVFYTSGSTGVSKGVRLTQTAMLNRLKWSWENYPFSITEKYAIFKTNFSFLDSVWEIWGPLLKGVPIVIIPRCITKNTEKLVDILEYYKIERLVAVSTLIKSILVYLSMQQHKKLLLQLKTWISSGEPLPFQLAMQFYDYYQDKDHFICNFYGCTELMADVVCFTCTGGRDELQELGKIPMGYPVSNTWVYILDENLQPVPENTIGEIYVSGLNLSVGYVLNRDDGKHIKNPFSDEKMFSRLFRTGDFGCLRNGLIYFEGRTDSQIKIRGHRVDLSEIERNVMSVPGITNGVVLCFAAGQDDQALLAFVTTADDANLTGFDIEKELKDLLTTYMIPLVTIVRELPYLENGKIDRQTLLKLYEDRIKSSLTNVEYDLTDCPDDRKYIARHTFQCIANILGGCLRSKMSLSSNFYELGGNSLNSIITVAELNKRGLSISVNDFLQAANIGEIISRIHIAALSIFKDDLLHLESPIPMNFRVVPLTLDDTVDIVDLITKSVSQTGKLKRFLNCLHPKHFKEFESNLCPKAVAQNLSYILKNSDNRTVAVAINFRMKGVESLKLSGKIEIINAYFKHIQDHVIKNNLPANIDKILYTYLIAISLEFTARQNIAIISSMEEENIKLAKRNQFEGIFTTNTSPLTQQLAKYVFGYSTLAENQQNQYVDMQGNKPFEKAPDSQKILVQYKDIGGLQQI